MTCDEDMSNLSIYTYDCTLIMIISGYKFYCTKNANENPAERKEKKNAMAMCNKYCVLYLYHDYLMMKAKRKIVAERLISAVTTSVVFVLK